jgi:hypothetical protein
MSEEKHYNVIWLMIGLLLALYGIMIVGAGVYHLVVPEPRNVVLSNLHPELWWGGLMILVGFLFCYYHMRGR